MCSSEVHHGKQVPGFQRLLQLLTPADIATDTKQLLSATACAGEGWGDGAALGEAPDSPQRAAS